MSVLTLLGNLISPVTNVISKVQENKAAKESAQAKLKQAKIDGEYKIEASTKEWEQISKMAEDGTYKDDVTTYTFLGILISVFIAAFLSAFTGDLIYINSVTAAVEQVKDLLAEDSVFSELMYIIVAAAVGINATKRIFK